MSDWHDQAACAGHDNPDLWFPEGTDQGNQAKAICAHCPVRDACLDDALEHDEKFGIRGGLLPRERRGMQPQARQRGMWRNAAKCGTNAGYHRHRREHTPACVLCLAAHAAHTAEYEHRRKAG